MMRNLGNIFIFIMLKPDRFHTHLNVNQIKQTSNDNILCVDLIKQALTNTQSVMELAKKIDEISDHPFFWSPKEILDFILEINKMIEADNNKFTKILYINSYEVTGEDWTTRVSTKLIEKLKEARQAYNQKIGSKRIENESRNLRNLILTIRNIKSHAMDEEMAEIVGRTDEEFVNYWTLRFPKLIMHLYSAMKQFEGN